MAIKINEISTMPQMTATFNGWQTDITLKVYTQTITNGLVTNTISSVVFKGVVQPLSSEQVQLKPEGQRSWEWLQIHVYNGSTVLKINDRILYDERDFKVMAIKNYKLNNYIEYHLVEDFIDE